MIKERRLQGQIYDILGEKEREYFDRVLDENKRYEKQNDELYSSNEDLYHKINVLEEENKKLKETEEHDMTDTLISCIEIGAAIGMIVMMIYWLFHWTAGVATIAGFAILGFMQFEILAEIIKMKGEKQ